MSPLNTVKPFLKAITAFVAPGVVALVQAVSDASPAGPHVTGPEWIGIVAACILTSAAVYAVPNLPRKEPEPPE
jgi:hypothetical protein